MATFNSSHHDSGGVVLFSGELILLYCDNVYISIDSKSQNANGRIYLTTHRIIFTSQPINQSLKSFSAPFYAMFDLSLEQPVFGANYIKGKVRNESQPDSQNGIIFKLKFSSGGAIEFGQAMDCAAKQASHMAQQMHFQPPPPYTATAGQFYQAPPTVYQPAYNCGFVLPVEVFSSPPPAGFVYAMEAPPPYPGLNTVPQQYAAYPQQAYPAYGAFPMAVPNGPVYQTGNVSTAFVATAPMAFAASAPMAPGFVTNNAERPPTAGGLATNNAESLPTYAEATKKNQ